MKYINRLSLYIFFLLLILLNKHGIIKATIPVSNDLKLKKEVTHNLSLNTITHDNKTGIALFIKNNGQWNSKILFRAKLSYADLYILKNGISMVKIDRTPFEKDGHYRGIDGKINGVRVDMNFDKANTQLDFIGKKKGNIPHHYILPSTDSKTAYAYAMIYVKSVYQGIDWRIYTTLFGELKHEFILHPEANPSQIKLLFNGHKNLKIINNKLEIETIYGSIFEQPPYSFYLLNKEKIPTQYRLKGNSVQFEIPKNYDNKQFIVIDPTLIFSTYSGSIGDNWGYTGTYGENGTGYSGGIVFDSGFPTTTGSFQMNFNSGVDVGILKYDATGSNLLYATYLGGDDIDIPHSLLLDKNNNLLIFGTTTSTNFPVTPNAYQSTIKLKNSSFIQLSLGSLRTSDIFLARLSSSGQNLLNSTYIGGLNRDGINSPISIDPLSTRFINVKVLYYNYGDSYRGDLAVDEAGDIYVSSVTESHDFPMVNAYQNTFGGGIRDGILFKLSSNMDRLIWSTYLGGEREDTLYNMKVLNDKIIVCGATNSKNSYLPTTLKFIENFSGINTQNVYQADGIVLNVNKSTGVVTDATYLGTTSGDQAYFIDSDFDGNIFVLGQTYGNYPRTSNTYGASNAGIFLQKLSPDLSTGLLSTTLGTVGTVFSPAPPNISPTAFLVSNCGDIYITGFAYSSFDVRYSIPDLPLNVVHLSFNSSTLGLPVTYDAFQKTTDGKDFYLMILSKDAEKLNYATFFGGDDRKYRTGGFYPGEHVDGGTNRFDKQGIIYHAVCAGCLGRNSFPTTPNAYSTTNKAVNSYNKCNNGFFKFDLLQLRPQFTTNTRDFNNLNVKKGCTPFPVLFSNSTNGNGIFEWDFGDGTTITKYDKTDILHTYYNPGIYTVTLTAKKENSCLEHISISTQITVEQINNEIVGDTTICEGNSYDLFITKARNITWKNVKTGAIISSQPRVTVSPTITTEYELVAVLGTTCQVNKKITVTVLPHLSTSFDMKVDSFVKNESSICSTLTSNYKVEFQNNSVNGKNFSWDFGDGSTSNSNETIINHVYKTHGIYKIKLIATNPNTCPQLIAFERTLEIKKVLLNDNKTSLICVGDLITLSAPEIINPVWYINEEFITRDIKPTVQPDVNTIYTARGVSASGCPTSQIFEVNLLSINELRLVKIGNNTCYNKNRVEYEMKSLVTNNNGIQELVSIVSSDFQIIFDMGDGVTYDTPYVVHEYKNEGTYTIEVTIKQKDCIRKKKTNVTLPNVFIPNVITPNGDNKNDKFIVKNDKNISLKIYDRWDNLIYNSKNYKNDWPPPDKKYNAVFNYEAIIEGGKTCNGWIEVLSQ